MDDILEAYGYMLQVAVGLWAFIITDDFFNFRLLAAINWISGILGIAELTDFNRFVGDLPYAADFIIEAIQAELIAVEICLIGGVRSGAAYSLVVGPIVAMFKRFTNRGGYGTIIELSNYCAAACIIAISYMYHDLTVLFIGYLHLVPLLLYFDAPVFLKFFKLGVFAFTVMRVTKIKYN